MAEKSQWVAGFRVRREVVDRLLVHYRELVPGASINQCLDEMLGAVLEILDTPESKRTLPGIIRKIDASKVVNSTPAPRLSGEVGEHVIESAPSKNAKNIKSAAEMLKRQATSKKTESPAKPKKRPSK